MTSQKSDEKAVGSKPANDINLYRKTAELGEYLFITLMTSLGFVGGLLAQFYEWLRGHLASVGKMFLSLLKKIGAFLALPFVRYDKAFSIGRRQIALAYEEKGFWSAAAEGARFVGRIVFGKRGLAVTVCNYLLPVISFMFLFNVVSYANNMTYALKLSVNGSFVGYVNDENTFTEAEKIVRQRINTMDSSQEVISFDPSYQLEMVGYKSMLTKYQLADKLLTSLDAQVVEGYGMYIGSSFYGVLEDISRVEQTLDELLSHYRTGADGESVAFEQEITFSPGLYLADSVINDSSIIRLITSKKDVAAYYTCVEGDSPYGIASKLAMSIEEIAALNPSFGLDSRIFVGDQILINEEKPFLAVTVTRREVYEENIMYDTVYVDDYTRYEGSSTITQEGVYGINTVTANVSYINGVEVRRKVLSKVKTSDPVDEIISLGVKPRPSNASVHQNVAVGQMYWPVGGADGGRISETMYGYGGYYRHSGVDITAPYGTPIYAADSGTVVLAQWYYGYGNCVMIQHPNGLKTVYGHASALHVSVGEQVTQGQQIADVGSTGQSTCNHLHFEVRINDVAVYPLDYLPWHQREPGCVEY